MPAIALTTRQLGLLQDLATRVLDSRKVGTDGKTLARDLLTGFFDVCMRWGLDGVLVALEEGFPPLDITDRHALADHPVLGPALIEKLDGLALDDGGPRSAKPRLLADCLVASLSMVVADEEDRTVTLGEDVRTAVTAALASVVDVDLAMPQIRDTIIEQARAKCEERYLGAFGKIAAQLDERGMHMLKQPKIPIDVVQAIQTILFEVRNAFIDRVARAAIDRAKEVLARTDATLAARIDQPITHRMTPRDVAILRVSDIRLAKVPAAVTASLLESLTDLTRIAWRAQERAVRPYAASQTFAVGDLIEHPKFGRGSVLTTAAQRIEVEFPDGRHTLVHVRK